MTLTVERQNIFDLIARDERYFNSRLFANSIIELTNFGFF